MGDQKYCFQFYLARCIHVVDFSCSRFNDSTTAIVYIRRGKADFLGQFRVDVFDSEQKETESTIQRTSVLTHQEKGTKTRSPVLDTSTNTSFWQKEIAYLEH